MNNLNDRNDSMVEILLSNKKIQEENLAIKNEVNRLNVLLEKAEADKKDIQKYMDEIENIIEGSERLEQESGEAVCEKNNKSKFDKGATLVVILMTVAAGIINCSSLYMSDEQKARCDYWLFIADIFTIIVNSEIIFHTGLAEKWDRNQFYCVGTRVLYVVVALGIFIAREFLSNFTALVINILSMTALICTFISNYKKYNCFESSGDS